MGNGNKRGLLDVANVGSCLSRLDAHHDDLWVNAAEGVDDNLTLDRLNGIYDNCNSTRVQHFLRFLSLNISTGEPRSETRMGMVPSDTHLVTTNLLHHVHELLLEDWVHRLD